MWKTHEKAKPVWNGTSKDKNEAGARFRKTFEKYPELMNDISTQTQEAQITNQGFLKIHTQSTVTFENKQTNKTKLKENL